MELDEENLFKILAEPVKNDGYELVDVKFDKCRSDQIIQLFIYNARGIEIEDCVNVNNLVLGIIKKKRINLDNYSLEISSPGIFRKLNKPEHFKIFKGKRIKVKLHNKVNGLKYVIGNIVDCTESGIKLRFDDSRKDLQIHFSSISKANLEPETNSSFSNKH